MLIKNASVLYDRNFIDADILISGERIKSVGRVDVNDEEIFDAEGLYAIAGFVDIHNHGFYGVDFYNPQSDFQPALTELARKGVSSVTATLICKPMDKLIVDLGHVVSEAKKSYTGAAIDAIHIEGPFISKNKSGAMTTPDIECNRENLGILLCEGGGMVKLVTIAPERENANEVIADAVKKGVRMSLGHTVATYDEAMAAIESGASGATHTFNAMRSYDHREPGILGAVLTDERVSCEAICDFVHLAPATVKLIYKQKGSEKMIMISDSGAMSGLGDGVYNYDGAVRIVDGNVCRNEEGRLAGSTASMLEGAKNLLSIGVSLSEVSRIASENPAAAIGLGDEIGTIEAGKRADIILCDDKLNIKAVFIRGEIMKI